MIDRSDCIFCRIAAGEAPAHLIHENEHALVILDINPLARGHCLVIPKRHVPWWHELTDSETESLFRAARDVAARLMIELEPDFVCMYARGRRIPHTHIFLVPTWGGDPLDRQFNALEGFQEGARGLAALGNDEALAGIAAKLRKPTDEEAV